MAYVIKVNHADTLRRLTFEKQPGGNDGLSFAELEGKIRELFQFPAVSKLKVTYVDKESDVVTMETDQDLKDACVYQSLNPLRLNVAIASPGANSSGGPSRIPSFNAAFGGLEEPLKDVLKNLRPENVKNMFQAYEPMFKDVRHPSHIPELVENIVKTAASQFASLSKNGGASTSIPAPSTNEMASQEGVPQAQNESSYNGCVHYGVGCDGCGVTPILGIRYKSLIKENYDLCSSCYAKAGASSDEYQIIDRAPFRPRHCRNPRGRMNMCPAMGSVGHMPRYHWGMRAPQDGQGGRLDARFVRDVSIFDGTELAPGTRFTKIWRLRNSGTAAWPANTRLVNVDGDDLGSTTVTPLEISEAGLGPEEEIEVSVDCVAPQKSGRYQSTWRLATPWGPKFGHKIWVQIQVVPADSLNQPAQVNIEGGDEKVAQVETSTAVPVEQVKVEDSPQEDAEAAQVGGTPAVTESSRDIPAELVKSENSPQDVEVVNEATSALEKMKIMEESFVKVDVNNTGDEAPLIQMTDMPSGSAEDEKSETLLPPTIDAQGTGRTDRIIDAPVDAITTEVPAPKLAESANAPVVDDTEGEDTSIFNALLVRLEAMGFNDRALNLELLKTNAFDLRKTVDALCAVDDWAGGLAELEEMGFNDGVVNRRLMFKNGGNLKRVVKELVQLAKEASGRGQ